MTQGGVTETVIEHELGCGAFQIVFIVFALITLIPTYCSVMMMSFGSYNPGWRCLDNITYNHVNDTGVMSFTDNQTSDYRKDRSCQLFKTCQHVEFDPDTSTIVTEWGLLCDKDWVPSLIISLQMAGVLVGLVICGQLADTIGRKKTFFGSLFANAVLNCIAMFSFSWQMFAVVWFFIGLCMAGVTSLYVVYPSEFLTRKWRAPVSGFPAWNISGVLFGVICMVLKDWRDILKVTSGMAALCFIPVFWIPESLRWLEVKNKSADFKAVMEKMAKLNRKTSPRIDSQEFVKQETSDKGTKKHTMLDLFRPGYKLISVAVGILCMATGLVYNAILFGIKTLGGNIYVNIIAINAATIPLAIFPALAPNIIGRKKSIFSCFLVMTTCLVVATCFELLTTGNLREIGNAVLIICVVAAVDTARPTITLMISEVYPTVVRGMGVSWGTLMARLGGIIAPFIIPADSGMAYVWYSIMASLVFVNCCVILFLPETKGRPLKQTFDKSEESMNQGET